MKLTNLLLAVGVALPVAAACSLGGCGSEDDAGGAPVSSQTGGQDAGADALAPGVDGGTSGPKALLQWSDLKWIGSYAIPDTYPTADNGYPKGIALRWVGNEPYPRLYLNFLGSKLFECQPTAPPSTDAPTPLPVLGYLGDPSGGLRPTGYPGAELFEVLGLHWDETDRRLYWSMWKDYDKGDMPDWGFSTLTDAAPSVMKTEGVWTSSRSSGYGNQWHSSLVGIPTWFANEYLGGRRLLLGFGGSRSMTGGPKHWGLAAFAAHPIDLTRDRATPYYQGHEYAGGLIPLSGHPAHSGLFATRLTWSGDWFEGSPGFNIVADRILGGGVWIDLPTKHGFLLSMLGMESPWRNATKPAQTVVTQKALAGATQITVADPPTDWAYHDLIFIQSNLARPGGNGNFGAGEWPHPLYGTSGGPYGEMVAITSVSGNVVTFERTDGGFHYTAGGLQADVEAGAAVIAGNSYWDAVVPSTRIVPQTLCFDPMQFAEVAQGKRQWNDVTWAWGRDSIWPDLPRHMPGGNIINTFNNAVDMAWDERTHRLYVLRGAGPLPTGPWSPSRIYVFQID